MKQEDKELLLRDLGARLSYKVIVDYSYNVFNIHNGNYVKHGSKCILTCYLLDIFMSPRQNENGEYIKAYLRPLSSMTDEEKQLVRWFKSDIKTQGAIDLYMNRYIEWLDSKHFDWRTDGNGKTLIEKGFALEAPEGMYN